MSNIIRITESDLRKIVKRSVNKILKEQEYSHGDLRKDYENHLSWLNKERRDTQDRIATTPSWLRNHNQDSKDYQDFEYFSNLARTKNGNPNKKPYWDFGYEGKFDDPYVHGDFDDKAENLKDAYEDEWPNRLWFLKQLCDTDKSLNTNESTLHRIVKESVNKILNEKIIMPSLDSNGDVIKCFTTRNAINGLNTSGSIFGKGIYLKVGEPPVEGNDYGQTFITVDVATNNLYFANDIRDAMEAAKSGNVPGIVFNSKHDGEVCVVFDDSIILGTSR